MSRAGALSVRFWGVRGSYPTPGPGTAGVGGNSSCVEISSPDHTLVFDAGTGLIPLGRDLVQRRGEPEVSIFLSHLHHDHIEGLRFFAPAYTPEWRCIIYGGGSAPRGLRPMLARLMAPHLFPVSLTQLSAQVTVRQLKARDRVRFRSTQPVTVSARFSRAHPKVGVTMYRVASAGRTVVYATDVEGPKGGFDDVVGFARGADILIHDAQYTDAEYHGGHLNKAGWGHSTVRMAAEAARAAGVGELLLYHHDPEHDDAEIHDLERLGRTLFPRTRAAVEGMEIRLPAR